MPSQKKTAPVNAPSTETAAKKGRLNRWLDRSSLYGFELFMSFFGLLTAAYVIDWGLFTLFNSLASDSQAMSRSLGEMSLWVAAAMFIWIPLALVFYARTRGQLIETPDKQSSTIHKIFVSVYLFFNTVSAAGAAFAVVYSLIRMAIGEGDAGQTLLRVTVPAMLMVALHVGLLFAYSRSRLVTRKSFALTFGAIGLVVITALLVTSVSDVRAIVQDGRTASDLRTIETEVRGYYRENMTIPETLDELSIDEDDIDNDISDYTYNPETGNQYQLCGTFAAKTNDDTDYYDDEDRHQTYGSFGSHDEGLHCFKLQAGFLAFPSDSQANLRDRQQRAY